MPEHSTLIGRKSRHTAGMAALIALSLLSGALGQALMLSAAPHYHSVRALPCVLKKHLARAILNHPLSGRSLPPAAKRPSA